jgi:hypothetical protein
MGGGFFASIGAGKSLAIVGENGARFLRNLHGTVERGIGGWNSESLARMRLPALYRGRRMVRVHCLAYPVLRIGMSKGLSGFAEGPLCFGVARGQGRAESRRFSPFTHDPPRSKRMRSIVGVPQAALAPLAHFSGCGPARLRQCRGSPRRSKPVQGLRTR